MVVPETQPVGHACADAPEAFPDALADRLQGLEAGPALGGMEPDARGRAVIDGHEDDGCPLGDGHGGRHVCAPHHVGSLGGDGPIVPFGPCAWPARGGAWRSCSRINRRTRSFEVRIPATHSFAQAFR